ncbi:unnamed protein product [Boreogadus saida]
MRSEALQGKPLTDLSQLPSFIKHNRAAEPSRAEGPLPFPVRVDQTSLSQNLPGPGQEPGPGPVRLLHLRTSRSRISRPKDRASPPARQNGSEPPISTDVGGPSLRGVVQREEPPG